MEALAAFGPYTILRAIAAGEDAVSFAARYEGKRDKDYILALKVLRTSLTQDESFSNRLHEELATAVRLNHVNVAQTFDAGRVSEGNTYIALEFVDGVPLALVVSAVEQGQKAVTTEVAAFICAEACAGIAYAHGRRDERGKLLGICHSRVTPRTVLLSKSGLVKMVDFGLARALTDLKKPLVDPKDAHFIAPEIARGEPFDHRADIFSVGALGYLLLTGQHIYEDATGDALEEKAKRGYVPAIRDVDASVPEELAELIDQALQSDPEKRFDDATALRSGLAAWLRRNSPGFGRHRLKTYLNRLLPTTTYGLLPSSDWETLHRKHFKVLDPDSLLHENVETRSDVPTEKDDLAALLTDPDVPTLGDIDVSRMASGAHQTVMERARARATARGTVTQRRPSVTGRTRKVRTPPPMPTVPTFPTIAKPDPVAATGNETMVMGTGEAVSKAEREDKTEEEVFASRAPAAPERPSVTQPDEDIDVEIPRDVPDFEGIEIDPNMVYDDSIDASEQLAAIAEADALTRPPRSWGSIVGIILGIGLLAALGFGGKYIIDQQAAIAEITPDRPVSVFITSRPQGAEVLVDGQPTGLVTPAPLRDLPGATAAVTVRMDGFESAEPQTLDPSAPPGQMAFEMQPAEHSIRVDSDPAGAEVIFEGETAGVTPMVIGPVRRDYRQGVDFILRMDGYFDEHVSVDWTPNAGESSVRRPLRTDPNYVPPEGELQQ